MEEGEESNSINVLQSQETNSVDNEFKNGNNFSENSNSTVTVTVERKSFVRYFNTKALLSSFLFLFTIISPLTLFNSKNVLSSIFFLAYPYIFIFLPLGLWAYNKRKVWVTELFVVYSFSLIFFDPLFSLMSDCGASPEGKCFHPLFIGTAILISFINRYLTVKNKDYTEGASFDVGATNNSQMLEQSFKAPLQGILLSKTIYILTLLSASILTLIFAFNLLFVNPYLFGLTIIIVPIAFLIVFVRNVKIYSFWVLIAPVINVLFFTFSFWVMSHGAGGSGFIFFIFILLMPSIILSIYNCILVHRIISSQNK